MADKFEREIEEILAKLDGEGSSGAETPGKKPIPIASAKRKQQKKQKAARATSTSPFAHITPTTLLFAGAGTMVAGLILSNFYGPLIWASFAGVVLFLGAFAWSFRASRRPASGPAPKGYYWRDRYIEYEPANPSAFDRLTRRLRRR